MCEVTRLDKCCENGKDFTKEQLEGWIESVRIESAEIRDKLIHPRVQSLRDPATVNSGPS